LERNYHEKCKGCGQFMQVTDAATEEALAQATRRIEQGNFSDGVRARLANVRDHYRELANKALTSR
jgi:hypothetical protein